MDVRIPVQTMVTNLKRVTPGLFNSDRCRIDLKYSG